MSPKASEPQSKTEKELTAVAAYIDSVESGVARVLLQGSDGEWHGHSLPALLLPKGAAEGSWLQISLRETPAPAGMDSSALRKLLGKGDTGGDIKL